MTILFDLRLAALVAIFFTFLIGANAQAPEAIPYQAVARNSSGNLLQNQLVGLRFSIRDGDPPGTVVYQETHNATTNNLGLFSVNIGQGIPVTGTFDAIDWGGGSKFTQVELDPAGGTAYVDMGTVQMLSVPYALYAETSGGAPTPSKIQDADDDTKIETEQSPDEDAIRLRIGGTEYYKFNKGKIEVNGTGGSIYLGEAAGLADPLVVHGRNVGIGANSLQNVLPNSDLSGNTALGARALQSLTDGNNNTAIGYEALRNFTGSYNTAVGYGAGRVNSNSGSRNVFLGTNAGGSAAGSGHVFIGYYAGTNETSNDRLYIDNSPTSNPLIWGDFASDLLNINGKLGIGTSTPAEKLDVVGTIKTVGFQMPTGAASGHILQSDAGGNASWVAPTSLSVMGDNLGNHAANQNINLNGQFISNDGSNFGLQLFNGLNYTQSGDFMRINFGNNSNNFVELAFKSNNRDWNMNASEDKFQLVEDGSSPFVVEKQSGNNRLYIKGDYVGIGHNNPTELLDVDGKTKTVGFQMPTNAASGYILQSDASGNASWVAPPSLVTDTDDQTLSLSGTALSIANGNSVDISQKQIKDADADTKIQVEESSDEDKIRFDLGGTEKWVMTGSRLEPANTGNSVFIGTGAGSNDDLSSNDNVAIGFAALNVNTTGDDNAALGSQALRLNTEGNNNTAIGRLAMYENTTGNNNTAVGYGARQLGTSGNNNTAIGNGAGYTATGSSCVFIGYQAGFYETGDNKIYIDNSSTSSPLIWGDFSSNYVNINGNLGIGNSVPSEKLDVNGKTKTTNFQMTTGAANGYVLQSDASGNASWVTPTSLPNVIPTKIQDADADTKIETEQNADEDMISLSIGGTEYYQIGKGKIGVNGTGGSIYIGESAGAADDFSQNARNVGIGGNALQNAAAVGSQTGNTAVGARALQQVTNGVFNSAFGFDALRYATGHGNTALGYGAGVGNSDYSSSHNTFVGSFAGQNGSGGSNTYVGYYAGSNNTTGSGNVFLGKQAGASETGSNKLYIANSSTSSPLIWGDFSSNYVNINGNLGVGTNAPIQAKLVVNGSESTNIGGYGFINDNGNTGTSSGGHNYSIFATDRIAGTEFNAHSDARIKRVRGRSNNAADLETLMQLKITDYTLIDTVTKGTKPYKKVIAQEVEQVYPQAVSTLAGVAVPDIFLLSKIENGFVVLENTGLKPGERVKLIFGEKQEIAEVIAVSGNGFQTNLKAETGQVFVFGREVFDFRTVDYEALSMLNVSATQALVKRLVELEKQNAALQSKVKEMDKFNDRMDALEAMLKVKPNN